jgi:hypothetical protein
MEQQMFYIIANNPLSNSTRRHPPKQHGRRYSAEAWDGIRDQISREHRVLAAADPRSPWIKPSLSPVQWSVR